METHPSFATTFAPLPHPLQPALLPPPGRGEHPHEAKPRGVLHSLLSLARQQRVSPPDAYRSIHRSINQCTAVVSAPTRTYGVRVRFHIYIYIIRNVRIENVGKSQPCMFSKLRIIWKQTVRTQRNERIHADKIDHDTDTP